MKKAYGYWEGELCEKDAGTQGPDLSRLVLGHRGIPAEEEVENAFILNANKSTSQRRTRTFTIRLHQRFPWRLKFTHSVLGQQPEIWADITVAGRERTRAASGSRWLHMLRLRRDARSRSLKYDRDASNNRERLVPLGTRSPRDRAWRNFWKTAAQLHQDCTTRGGR